MIQVEKALELIKSEHPSWGEERLPLIDCVGKTLCENILADREYPPFNRVMMDGIAVQIEAINSGVSKFKMSDIAPAGAPPKKLDSKHDCIEVMTGAMLPEKSDVVIPYEEVKIKDGRAEIEITKKYTDLQNVHLKGSDTKKGDVLLKIGQKLRGPHIGICASVGKSKVLVKRAPKVNIISTGDELVEIEKTPEQYQIRSSNAAALQSVLRSFGHTDVHLSHLRDDQNEIRSHFENAIRNYDVLIYSGGVSKGKFDFLPKFWVENGVDKVFHGVSQRPGKPLWFGVERQSNTAIFGLPGNPVSSLVCLRRYFLREDSTFVELGEDISFKGAFTYFAPVRLGNEEGKLKALPVSIKNSGEFSALGESDGFIELSKDEDNFKAGEVFEFFSWGPM